MSEDRERDVRHDIPIWERAIAGACILLIVLTILWNWMDYCYADMRTATDRIFPSAVHYLPWRSTTTHFHIWNTDVCE